MIFKIKLMHNTSLLFVIYINPYIFNKFLFITVFKFCQPYERSRFKFDFDKMSELGEH